MARATVSNRWRNGRSSDTLDFCESQQPCTVRGVYYNLTTKDLVAKTDAGYQQVARACKKLRMEGRLPWGYIVQTTHALDAFKPQYIFKC